MGVINITLNIIYKTNIWCTYDVYTDRSLNKHLYKPFVPNDQVTKAYNLIINHKPKFVEQTTATNIKLFADYV